MEIYILQNGRQQGPFPLYRLRQLVTDGEVSEQDLGWIRGTEAWQPLHEIDAVRWIFESPDAEESGDGDAPGTVSETAAAPIEGPALRKDADEFRPRVGPPPLPGAPPRMKADGPEATGPGATARRAWRADSEGSKASDTEVHAEAGVSALAPLRPWVRFWARGVDLTLFLALVSAATIPFGLLEKKHAIMAPGVQFMVLITVAWAFVEAYLLATWGTTPGKALLRVTVRPREHPDALPSLGQALKRSLLVSFFGLGFGITPLRELSLALSFYQLRQTGRTFWDTKLDLVVTHREIGPARTFAAVAIIVGWSVLSVWIALQDPALREALMEAVEQARRGKPSA